MSYTPTVWNSGDIITAEKLNKLENGVGSGESLIVGNIIYTNADIAGIYGRFTEPIAQVIARIEANDTNTLPSYVTVQPGRDQPAVLCSASAMKPPQSEKEGVAIKGLTALDDGSGLIILWGEFYDPTQGESYTIHMNNIRLVED